MFFWSAGFKCGTIWENEPTLRRGAMITLPERAAGSTACASFWRARMEAYSVPCAPATKAMAGPGFAPLMRMTGMLAAASDAAGIAIQPLTRSPDRAVAEPTVRSAADAVNAAASRQAAAKDGFIMQAPDRMYRGGGC